jgi:hypothetical protein
MDSESDLDDFIVPDDENMFASSYHNGESDSDSFGSIDYPEESDHASSDAESDDFEGLTTRLLSSRIYRSRRLRRTLSSPPKPPPPPPPPKPTSLPPENPLPEYQGDEEGLPPSFLCPVSMAVMREPIVTRYGVTYDRESIVRWLKDNNNDPLSRKPLTMQDLSVNRALKDTIQFVLWPKSTAPAPQPIKDVKESTPLSNKRKHSSGNLSREEK